MRTPSRLRQRIQSTGETAETSEPAANGGSRSVTLFQGATVFAIMVVALYVTLRRLQSQDAES